MVASLAVYLVREWWWHASGAVRALARQASALSPLDLRHHVAAVFQARGWRAQVTPASGDGGADVVAISPAGVRVGVWVRHDRGRVGTEAVQGVLAARPVGRATGALVVTRGPGYTRAAEQLARASGVTLWRLNDLCRWHTTGVPAELPAA